MLKEMIAHSIDLPSPVSSEYQPLISFSLNVVVVVS